MGIINDLISFSPGQKALSGDVNGNLSRLAQGHNENFNAISDIQANYLQKSGGTLSGDVDMNLHKVVGLKPATVTGNALPWEQIYKATGSSDSVKKYLAIIGSTATLEAIKGREKLSTIANNATDAVNDIDFGAGYGYDSTDAFFGACVAMTKRLDALFVEGTNQGGLDTGGKANSTWYHCFDIWKSDGTNDKLFSLSAKAPTMPADYSYFRRAGSVKTDTSGNIIGFTQIGDEFIFKTPILDVNVLNPGISGTLRTLSVPLGVSCISKINAWYFDGGADTGMLISSPYSDDLIPLNSTNGQPNIGTNTGADAGSAGQLSILTNTLSQVRTRVNGSGASTKILIVTTGYVDKRGTN